MFQELQLLRELPPDELLREKDGKGNLSPSTIRAWEESLDRHERRYAEPVSIEELITNWGRQDGCAPQGLAPRFVVLGPPGSGKSTFVQALAWRTATGRLKLPIGLVTPVRLRLREWQHAGGERLALYLAKRYADLRNHDARLVSTPEQWSSWLASGGVLLLLDGLDEVDLEESFRDELVTTFSLFPECPIVLTCRSVSFETYRSLCLGWPIFRVSELTAEQRNHFINAWPSKHANQFNRAKLVEQLDKIPTMLPLWSNPLLLGIICFAMDNADGTNIPARCCELYARTISSLLERTPKAKPGWNGLKIPIEERRNILEKSALYLFAGNGHGRALLFTEEMLLVALKEAARASGHAGTAGSIACALLDDSTINTGLLRRTSQGDYHFLHLTLHEYLAGRAMARFINENGWSKKIQLTVGEDTVCSLLDSKSWDPAWKDVITFCAGELGDPGPLLRLLADKRTDAGLRPRLCLAANCLGEVDPNKCSFLQREIVEAVLDLWRQNQIAWHNYPSMDIALTSIGPRIGPKKLDAIAAGLYHHQDKIRRTSYRALVLVASKAIVTKVTKASLKCLRNPNTDVRRMGVWVMGEFGAISPSASVIKLLVELLHDSDPFIRSDAASSLKKLGPSVATPAIIEAILDCIWRSDVASWIGAEHEYHQITFALLDMGIAAIAPQSMELFFDYVQSLELKADDMSISPLKNSTKLTVYLTEQISSRSV